MASSSYSVIDGLMDKNALTWTLLSGLCLAMVPETLGFSPLAVPRAAFAGCGSLAAAQFMRSTSGPRMSSAQLTSDTEVLPALKETAPLKIGLMVEPTPFTHVSGYSNRYKEMLTYLQQAGDEVEIITADDTESPPTEFLGFPIDYTSGFRFALYPVISMSVDHQLKGVKMIKRLKPDILHVTTPGFMVLVCGIYAKMFGIPLIMTYHTHLPVYARNYLGWFPFILPISWLTVKYIHAQADLTLVTSPQLKAEFEEQGIERVEVWRKGIDTVSFNPKWKNTATRNMLSDGNPDDFLMVYIGRLGREKRIEELRAVLDKNPNVRLAIVGGGPYSDTLKEVFKGSKTVFTGILRGQPLWEAFASGDVFCMPSDSETLGFVVLESLASGVPVIGRCLLSFSLLLYCSLDPPRPPPLYLSCANSLCISRCLLLSLSLALSPPSFLSSSLPPSLSASLPLSLSVCACLFSSLCLFTC